jgi:hypothetical protein
MNGDELREALRPSGDIDPLDPAKVIAGAHRRRRRGIATVGASAGAVLAVVAVGVVVGIQSSGSPVIEQPVAPSSSTPTPISTPTPSASVVPPLVPPTATPTTPVPESLPSTNKNSPVQPGRNTAEPPATPTPPAATPSRS